MLKIGLTGGIGSGKTTVAKIFEVLGVPVYYADDAAKKLMNEHEPLKKNIKDFFGDKAYTNGSLNREYISKNIYDNPGNLQQLNAMVHPETLRDANEWMEAQIFPYVIKEAAILFEAGADKLLDKVIGVSTPLNMRIKYLQKRNAFTEEDIMKRINMQMNEDEKMMLCDYIIHNDEVQLLIPQVLKMHGKFMQNKEN